jgi:hypothetical protein
MGTRSCIAVQHGDIIKAVYCHWDGYLSHNGRILQEHYNSERANYLVALGDVSSLGAELEPSKDSGHSFKTPEKGVCVFYGRDRGDTGVGFKTCFTFADLLDSFNFCEYFYLMQDGEWWVSEGGAFELLSTALNQPEDQE